MTTGDAAALGLYASELFRFVTPAQKHAVAELMLPVRDVVDETGDVMQDALDVGRGILRAMSASAGDEQRLNLSGVNNAVRIHMRLHGYPATDPPPNEWKYDRAAESQARAYEDSTHRWACELPTEDVEILTAEAMKSIKDHARYLFENKDIRTSRILRNLAYEFYRKANAFN